MSDAVMTLLKTLVNIVDMIEVVTPSSDIDCFLAYPILIYGECACNEVVDGKQDAPDHHWPEVPPISPDQFSCQKGDCD